MEFLKAKAKVIFPVLSIISLLILGCIGIMLTDNSDAATHSQTWSGDQHDGRTIDIYVGDSISFVFSGTSSGRIYTSYDVQGKPEWVERNVVNNGGTINTAYTGTATTEGTYSFNVWWTKNNDNGSTTASARFYVTINVHALTTHTLSYNANGGSGAPTTQSIMDSNTSVNMTISSDLPMRSGYTFLGWSTDSAATTATYTGGNTVSVGNGTVTLYAVWQVDINVSDQTVLTGDSFFITPVIDGNVSVAGADWLIANGNTVYGTAPSTPGTYNVTINCGASSGTFIITVLSALAPTNSPSNGAIVFVRG